MLLIRYKIPYHFESKKVTSVACFYLKMIIYGENIFAKLKFCLEKHSPEGR